MISGMGGLARRMAAQCRLEARWLRGGTVTAALTAWACIYHAPAPWAIAFLVLAAAMEFIGATLRHDAKALDRLAKHYECEESNDNP